MAFDAQLWTRFDFEGTPIYVRPDRPGWFVPNGRGDALLKSLATEKKTIAAEPFLARLPDAPGFAYRGRYKHLNADSLNELWFHITNRCNLTCAHCLFSSGPESASELSADAILCRAEEAYALGCRIFALTGGEPLCHPEIDDILAGLLQWEDAHVVMLTNGLLLERLLSGSHDLSRIHLQISVDGIGARHDAIRGEGAFERLCLQLEQVKERQLPFTVSMCVERRNLEDMDALVDFAAQHGASNLHYLWYFVKGRGQDESSVPPAEIFPKLRLAAEKAEQSGLQIDNLAAMKTQIFAPAGTMHDGSSSGWESAAIGPDGKLYPSAALVGEAELATEISTSLAEAWKSSPVLDKIRRATIAHDTDPLRFFTGGGDLDHSWVHAEQFIGADPYLPLYKQLILWLISSEAAKNSTLDHPALLLKMGDILESCGAHGHVALTHANCLLAIADHNSRDVVKRYYSAAATDTKDDILNPVCYAPEDIAHIPEQYRFRGYGCGSPVLDAKISAGETVVDLGSGRGIEIFIAAKQAGQQGRAIGVDMLDPMLEIAEEGAVAVREKLGYDSIEFRKGYLESLPLDDNATDLVLSNCVMNLSSDKRRAFSEILRALKPGGRLVISDVVCEDEPDVAIRNDAQLQGECISGALVQKDLVGLLQETGFIDIRLLKRFPYRVVHNHPFYSLTFAAWKPAVSDQVPVIYRGPLAQLPLPTGQVLLPGHKTFIPAALAEHLDEHIFILDQADGSVTNLDLGSGCACVLPPESPAAQTASVTALKHRSGCMVCGGELIYPAREIELSCHYCGQKGLANAHCDKGHYVCDSCHSEDAVSVIEHLCLESTETDMLELLARLRKHPAVPVNGPEHHSLLPGVIVTAYRNSGGHADDELITTAIRRGSQVIGGSCAFVGICGAASGVGIAFSLLLQANPVRAIQRQQVQQITQQVLAEIAAYEAARCCQRDCWIGVKKAAELSADYLPVTLKAEAVIGCQQRHLNHECLGNDCPLLQEQISARKTGTINS